MFPPGSGFGPLPTNISQPPPPHIPDEFELQNRFSILRGDRKPFNVPFPPPFFANNASNFHIPAQTSSFNRRSGGHAPPSGNLLDSQTATVTREKVKEGDVVYNTKD